MVSKQPTVRSGKELKKQSLIQLFLFLVILFTLNFISSFFFTRFDLTSENRYTLSPATKSFIKNIKDVVYVKVYLEGDLPAGFRRLRNNTREMLDEFRAYSNGNIEYEFVDPSANPDARERNQLYNQLADKGLQPTNIEQHGKGEASQKIIFPGAVFTYHGQEHALQLLKSKIIGSEEEMLNNSMQNLEFAIANEIRGLITVVKPKIGFLQGHAEMRKLQIADLANSLAEFYRIDSVVIDGKLKSLDTFKALVIAKPDSAFSEKDKFVLDQFIMNGGKVLWMIDKMNMSMDSLRNKEGSAIAIANSLNLDDQLFRYGVRINADLIQDLQAAPILVTTGYVGNQPSQKLLPWFFFPLLFPTAKHPIVNNINAVKCQFVSSLDTVSSPGVKKTILLSGSQYGRLLYNPVRINLGMMRLQPDPKQFNKPFIPVAALLEGTFTSVFKNRVPPQLAESKEINFKSQSIPSKMIVISDGDLGRNDVKKGSTLAYPLGYDRLTHQTFGNKTFLLNCVDYLCDESGLIAVRSKELKLRLLNHTQVEEQKMFWQILNTLLPVLMIILLGTVITVLRRRKYAAD